ncbi:hypothetical protein GIB67_030614 [Kingdonia uniflora]|uniref:Uncharacterized protein n=1 Tax=Kingdonia uniflora TaxID=39325 RepID=A0A7J7LMK6_9MAGN|nr:hypothetical protein GIB67_030614 [Kingdonia uniflora]
MRLTEFSSIPSQFTVDRTLTRVNTRISTLGFPSFINLLRKPTKLKDFSTNLRMNAVRNGVGERDGVIIVDHGSRRQKSNLMLNEFVSMFKDETGYAIVEPAHMIRLCLLY